MKTKKKPDTVVYNEEIGSYDASLKAYGTNVGAPAIQTNDTVAWKNQNIHKVNKQVKARFDEIKAQYDELMQQYEYNQLIYGAKFNFQPEDGHTYHLYKDDKGNSFLSIIQPNECKFNHLGSFKLNTDKMWQKI